MNDDDTPDPKADTGFYKLGGFNTMMGIRFTERGDGWLKSELSLRDDHKNKAGFVHGGVYAAMLDSSSTGAGLWCPYPGRIRQSSTLSLTVNYVGLSRGGTLFTEAKVTRAGRTIYSVAAEVRDDEGNLCAHSIGTFKYMRGSEDPRGVALDGA